MDFKDFWYIKFSQWSHLRKWYLRDGGLFNILILYFNFGQLNSYDYYCKINYYPHLFGWSHMDFKGFRNIK